MKKKILFSSIIIELAIISFLGFNAYKKYHDPFLASMHPISKDSFIFSPEENLAYFYEPKPNTTDFNNQERLSYKSVNMINSDALHERFEYSIEKPENTFRIVSLGDSFTFGLYTNTEDNYSEILEDLLNNNLYCKNTKKFEVINLGVPGYDIQYSLERFKRRGQKNTLQI